MDMLMIKEMIILVLHIGIRLSHMHRFRTYRRWKKDLLVDGLSMDFGGGNPKTDLKFNRIERDKGFKRNFI